MLEIIKDNRLWILLLLGIGFTILGLMQHKDKINIHWWSAALLSFAYAALGVLSVKVFAAIERWDFSTLNGMSMFGTVFFMPIFYWVGAKITRNDPATFFDILTPCIIFVLLCTRINCLLSGCCLGAVIPGTLYRFPTREAEILFFAVLIIHFWKQSEKKDKHGTFFPMYMVSYGIFRLLQEGFREAETGTVVHIAHLWAVISAVIGAAVLIRIHQKHYGRRFISLKK